MTYPLVVSQRAEKHIEEAFEWYEQQRSGLGDSFLTAVDLAFQSIGTNPQFYGFRKAKVRGCLLKGFPFIILFYKRGNIIRVVSVFHMSRAR